MEPYSSPSSSTSVRAQDIWISEPDDFNTYFMTNVESQHSSGKYVVISFRVRFVSNDFAFFVVR